MGPAHVRPGGPRGGDPRTGPRAGGEGAGDGRGGEGGGPRGARARCPSPLRMSHCFTEDGREVTHVSSIAPALQAKQLAEGAGFGRYHLPWNTLAVPLRGGTLVEAFEPEKARSGAEHCDHRELPFCKHVACSRQLAACAGCPAERGGEAAGGGCARGADRSRRDEIWRPTLLCARWPRTVRMHAR